MPGAVAKKIKERDMDDRGGITSFVSKRGMSKASLFPSARAILGRLEG